MRRHEQEVTGIEEGGEQGAAVFVESASASPWSNLSLTRGAICSPWYV